MDDQKAIESLLALYKSGSLEECLESAESFVKHGSENAQVYYIAANAANTLGYYRRAKEYLARIAIQPGNNHINVLAASVNQSIDAQSKLPADFIDQSWYLDKSVLRIGGRARLLDAFLNQAGRLIDLNATPSRFGVPTKADILCDAHDLHGFADSSIGMIVSSHTIEHLVNPLLALREWHRVLMPGGIIYSCIPNYRHTFDHRRELTTIDHLIGDLRSGSTAIDWPHVLEFLRNHDCDRDFVFKGDKSAHLTEFIKGPHLHTHYHVFDLPLVYVMHEYVRFETIVCFEADISVHYLGKRI